MLTYEGEQIEKSIEGYKKDIETAKIKKFLSGITAGGVMAISVLAGLIIGHYSQEFLKWMLIAPVIGGTLSLTPFTIYFNSINDIKQFKADIAILNDKLEIEKRKSKDISSVQSIQKSESNTNQYRYDRKNITEQDMDEMIDFFKGKDDFHEKGGQKR